MGETKRFNRHGEEIDNTAVAVADAENTNKLQDKNVNIAKIWNSGNAYVDVHVDSDSRSRAKARQGQDQAQAQDQSFF